MGPHDENNFLDWLRRMEFNSQLWFEMTIPVSGMRS